MFGRKDSNTRGNPSPAAAATQNEYGDEESATQTYTQLRASELIGGSGISLDGKSLVLSQDRRIPRGPPEVVQPDDGDDVSSINTSVFGGASRVDLRSLSQLENGRIQQPGQNMHDIDYSSIAGTKAWSANRSDPSIAGDARQAGTVSSRKTDTPSYSGSTNRTDDGSRTKSEGSAGNLTAEQRRAKARIAASGGCACIPNWIYNAPVWLKCLIVSSTALLVSSAILIAFGFARVAQVPTATGSSFERDNSPIGFYPTATPPPASYTPPTLTSPTMSPATTAPTSAPSQEVIVSQPTPEKPTGPLPTEPQPTQPPRTEAPITIPTVPPPTDGTVVSTTSSPTLVPTMRPTNEYVTFFVTAGRFTGAALENLPANLASLPTYDGETVLFHLGDWNSPYATNCVESSYVDNVNVYSQSSVPVYFVPGDNEYNDCPNATEAFDFWHSYIRDFPTQHFAPPDRWTIDRQVPDYSENFAYVYNRILFVGVNLVGGSIHDQTEWNARHYANLGWINQQFQEHLQDFEYMVILAHADPSLQSNSRFFDILLPRIQNEYSSREVIYVNRNLGLQPWKDQPAYSGISNLRVVVVQGSVWPPMRIQINPTTSAIDIDQSLWNV